VVVCFSKQTQTEGYGFCVEKLMNRALARGFVFAVLSLLRIISDNPMGHIKHKKSKR
jgi:hypothetical protein